MGKKQAPQKESTNQKKLNWATLGSIFPTKKEGRSTFKPKLDKYGVKSIEVTLNSGEVYELDADMFVMVTEKTIKTKNGEMDIQEVSLGY